MDYAIATSFLNFRIPDSHQILMHHIRATLPDIKARIAQQLSKYSSELKALGGAMGETNPVGGSFLKVKELAHADNENREASSYPRSRNSAPNSGRLSTAQQMIYLSTNCLEVLV